MKRTEPGVSPFWDLVGMKEVSMEHGKAEVRLDITPGLLQRRGFVHGGAIATLIDGTIGSAVRSTLKEEELSSTVEMKINYVRPASGEFLIGKAVISHAGKQLMVGTAEVFNEEGKLVAMGSATFFIIRGQK